MGCEKKVKALSGGEKVVIGRDSNGHLCEGNGGESDGEFWR